MRQGRERGGEGGGGGGKEGGVHRVLDHTYPELSVARATLVFLKIRKFMTDGPTGLRIKSPR